MSSRRRSALFALMTTVLIAFFLTLHAPTGFAADVLPPEKRVEAITPLWRDGVSLVVYIDLATLEPSKFVDWMMGQWKPSMTEAELKDVSKRFNEMTRWTTDLQAAGGRHIVAVWSFGGIGDEPLVFVPLEKDANARAIQGLLNSGKADGEVIEESDPNRPWRQITRKTDSAVIMGRAGSLEWYDGAKVSAPPAEVLTAFQTAGAAPVVAVANLPESDRRMVEDNIPNLPDPIGGGPITTITRSIKWAVGGLSVPPKGGIQLIFQSPDAQSAKDVLEMAQRVAKAMVDLRAQGEFDGMPDFMKFIVPEQKDDRVQVVIDQAGMEKLADEVGKALIKSRRFSMRIRSASNEKQILTACLMYSNEHDGAWPATLETLLENELKGSEDVMKNPAQPDREKGYVYLAPPKDTKGAADQIVVYEAYDTWSDGVNVGFADGRVEMMNNEQVFKDKLKVSQQRNAAPAK